MQDTMQETMPLPLAALALRLDPQTARSWVTRGKLDGWQNERGRWVVTVESVERAKNPA